MNGLEDSLASFLLLLFRAHLASVSERCLFWSIVFFLFLRAVRGCELYEKMLYLSSILKDRGNGR